MNYKTTLNLPKTDFPMRAHLPQREPEILARWLSGKLYERLLEKTADGPRYVLHDGPPYANGNVHLGTALNKIIKDVIVKRHLMAGDNAPYVPGWDCHGMPIEHQVLRRLGGKARSLSQLQIRARCREYAEKFYRVQREQFQRLGVLGDWDHPYLTMDPTFEAAIVRMFRRLVEGGFIYRGLRPVQWCPSCATALAEAEVEYAEHTSPSIYVRFAFTGSEDEARSMAGDAQQADELAAAHDRLRVVIWTTTPWTLPANLAVCFNPHLDYVALRTEDELFVVAARLADAFVAATGLTEAAGDRIPVTLGPLDGRDVLRHPFIDRPARVVFENHVTADSGTGCVHTAPGHGYDDFQVGQKYDLPVLTPVDERGRFTEEAADYAGRAVFECNAPIVEHLQRSGALVHSEELTHSYPHCWRCKSPLIFRATEQWFLRVDHNDLRGTALREIDKVTWVPGWGRDRIYHMVETRPDWCLSRQRAWGVPVPAFRCRGCGVFHTEPDLIRRVEEIFAKRGSDAWYELPAEEFLTPDFRCACGERDFEKDTNILDVWFDAGSSHEAVLHESGLGWPADVYVEAVDQHRGWFQVSLLTAAATSGRAPYRSVLTHGLILDEGAKKMSKSLGNVVSPDAVIKKYGADILRLLFTSVDFTADTCFSEKLLIPLLESYRRIRNTCRFLIGNLADFDPAQDALPVAELPELDRWILHRAQKLLQRSLAAYDGFAFHHVVQGLVTFCATDLSALYLDVVKDRLYCSAAASPGRRAGQTTLWHLLDLITRLMAPILSFTAEEIWGYVPGHATESVFEAGLPAVDDALVDDALAERWDRLLAVRSSVTRAIEELRKAGSIRHSLEARVSLSVPNDVHSLLNDHRDELAALFIVSQADLDDETAPADETVVTVHSARGTKCPRCWNFREDVGGDDRHPDLCGRCAAAVT